MAIYVYNEYMADGDGIFSGLGDVIGGELKKFGQSATHQVTGNDPGSSQTIGDDNSVLDQLKGFGKTVSSQVTGSDNSSSNSNSPVSNNNPATEAKKFGKSISSQLFGAKSGGGDDSGGAGAELSKMKKADDEFSHRESDVIRAKIARIYEEYAAKRKREKQQEEIVVKQEEQQQEELKKQEKEQDIERSIEVQKTRAENKNYGAE